ncbi:DNA-binding protein [Halorhabdus sp. CBA1104]|uniref:helix-turn-helix domain-containing protein n=1 Tax=Halorhabdus sp. CBA1104 TaxID=1380432 RepID=UPI0012B238D4|nr:helix-turn-helix domain-containing protein [Halorhabdus sp. CBA1104]QGN07351.1 DNA-binding protein [Halorhabdus sp. CBA1104]
MALRATYEITCEHLPFVSMVASVPDATLLVRLVPSQDEYTPFIVTVQEGPAPAVEKAFDEAMFVAGYTRLDESDAPPQYKVLPALSMSDHFPEDFDVGGLKALADTDSLVDEIRVTQTGWIQSGCFADRATLAEFQSFWERHGSFRLRRIKPVSRPHAEADGLTEPQREALLAAAEQGYFAVPRDASLADIAAGLDISASSLSERLRRGQLALIETYFDGPDA